MTASNPDALASPSYVSCPFLFQCPEGPLKGYPKWQFAYVTITRRKRPENLFDFQVTAQSRRPRPWDRVPKSPFATHLRGRKVWKRYELRETKSATEASASASASASITADVESSNSARPVKRLRVKQVPVAAGELQNQKPAASYITTLHETASGTPKSRFYFLRLYLKWSDVTDTASRKICKAKEFEA